MWLSDLSIKRPVFITMIMVALMVVGVIAYTRLPVDLLPDTSTPLVTVRTNFPGASPEVVEREVTKPIEDAVSPLSGVKSVESTSGSGVSVVRVEYKLEYPVDKAVNEVRERVSWAKRFFSRDVDEPVIMRFDPSTAPIIMFSLADKEGSMNPLQLRKFVDDEIRPRMERVDGVASVDVMGGRQREIHVLVSLARLQAMGLSPQQVSSAIRVENADIPGGTFIENGTELTLRTPVSFKHPQEIGDVVITTKSGVPVRVKDVAIVEDGYKDQRSFTRLDGQNSVLLIVRKQSGTNTIQVADGVFAEIDKISRDKPNLNIVITRDQSQFIRRAVDDTLRDLVLGGLLACIVVFIFFLNWRMTLITIAGLPVIVVGAFWGISMLGFGLNMITLLALALCIGLLIDDAIVVRENMFRHLEAGASPKVAASRGTAEIALAVLAMTFSIISVFLPVAFATGMIGKLFREFGLTISIAVAISLFEAFTLAPMLAAHFDPKVKKRIADSPKKRDATPGLSLEALKGVYRRVLSWSLSHRAITMGVVVVVFAASAFMVVRIGQSFTSDMDQGYFEISLRQPTGTTPAQADRVVRQAEAVITQQPEVAHVLARVGSGSGPEESQISVRLKERGHVKAVQGRLRRTLSGLDANTSVRFSSQSTSLTGSLTGATSVNQRPILLRVKGDVPIHDLEKAAEQVKTAISDIPGVTDADTTIRPARPGLSVAVNRARAADQGLSATSIGSTVRNLVYGDVASTFQDGNDQIDIVVRLQEQDRQKAQDIMSLPVVSPRGSMVPIRSFSSLVPSDEPTEINRYDRERQIRVGANLIGRAQGDVIADINKRIPTMNLPPEVSVGFAGSTLQMQESFKALYFVMALSLVFMYMVLASQLGSFVQPLIIMVALPLSVVGAIGALLVTGKYLDITAMIGMILLMGIVTKNSILLVDFANVRRRQGVGAKEAMLEAGQARLRPVLMTSAALIFGMLPVAIGLGAGAEFRSPMAITVIGGLITATILTLVVVPVIYTFVEGLKERVPATEKAPSLKPLRHEPVAGSSPFGWRVMPEKSPSFKPLAEEGKPGAGPFGWVAADDNPQSLKPLSEEGNTGGGPFGMGDNIGPGKP